MAYDAKLDAWFEFYWCISTGSRDDEVFDFRMTLINYLDFNCFVAIMVDDNLNDVKDEVAEVSVFFFF